MNTPAATAGISLAISARSSRSGRLKPAAAAENLFPLLEPQGDDEDAPTVYAFFVFRPTEAPDEEAEDDGRPDEADPTCSEFRP